MNGGAGVLLEVLNTNWKHEGLVGCAPNVRIPWDGLVEKHAEDVVGEVCVGLLQREQVVRAQQMKHKEVVSLTHEFGGYRPRLLRDKYAAEPVLAALLGPLHEDGLPFLPTT